MIYSLYFLPIHMSVWISTSPPSRIFRKYFLHIQFITQKSFFIVSIFFWTTTYKFPFFFILKYVQNQDTAYSLSNNNYYFKEVIIILKFYLSIIFFYCIFYTFNPPSMSFNLFLVRQKFFSFHNW